MICKQPMIIQIDEATIKGRQMKKALLLNFSPKTSGQTSVFINLFKQNFDGEIEQFDLFNKQVSPCIDCGGCKRVTRCVLNDDFMKILAPNYDVVVVASPLYMSNLPAPAFSLISRFNFLFNNKKHLGLNHKFKSKQAMLILTGGGGACDMLMGESNEDLAIRQAKYIFKKLNAKLDENDIILSLNTDAVPAEKDVYNKNKIIKSAKKLSLQ